MVIFLMLKSITLKFTELPAPLVVPMPGVTVFFVPNNSGKSLVLKEIEQHFQHHEKFTTKLVVVFTLIWPTEEQVNKDIEALSQKYPTNREDHFYLGRFGPAGEFEKVEHHKSTLIGYLRGRTNYRSDSEVSSIDFSPSGCDGRTRFNLTNDRSQGDLLAPDAQNVLAHLFRNDELREQVRDVVHDAFNVYFVIDPTDGGKLQFAFRRSAFTGRTVTQRCRARIPWQRNLHQSGQRWHASLR